MKSWIKNESRDYIPMMCKKGENSMEKNFLSAVDNIFNMDKFDLDDYFNLISLYGKDFVYKIFNYIKARSNNLSLLNKFFVAFLSIELDNMVISSNTYSSLVRRYGKRKIDMYFQNLLYFDVDGSIRKKYEKIYFFIDNSTLLDLRDDAYLPSVNFYLKEIAKFPTLKANEELALFEEIVSLKEKINIAYLDDNDNVCFKDLEIILDSITTKSQIKLIKKICPFSPKKDQKIILDKINNINSDSFSEEDNQQYLTSQLEKILRLMEIREKIINSNLKLVAYIAKMYKNFNADILDLIMEGNKGLIRAFQLFDVSKKKKFSTYASKWIRQKISLYLFTSHRVLPVSYDLEEKMIKYKNAVDDLSKSSSQTITDETVARYLNWPVKKVEKVKIAVFELAVQSLDIPVGEENDSLNFIELIEDKNADITRSLENENLKESINEIMKSILKEREIFVLEYRFGLNGRQVMTLEEIGKLIGITYQGVRDIEKKAINKLKHSEKARILKDFY